MATERIDIVVSDGGTTRVVKRDLEDLGAAAAAAGAAVGGTSRAFTGAASTAGAAGAAMGGVGAGLNVATAAATSTTGALGGVGNGLSLIRREAAPVSASLQQMAKQALSTGYEMRSLSHVMGTLLIGAAVVEIVKYGNEWQNVINKLQLVTTSSQNLADVNEAVYKTAQKTRTGYLEMATLYQDLALQAKRFGLSQQQIIEIMTTMTEAGKLANGGPAQLKHGIEGLILAIERGQFTSRAFNGVLKDTPKLISAIAEGMGVSVDELRRLSKAAQVTGPQIIEALQKAGPAVAEQFLRLKPTIADAAIVMANAWIHFIGELNNSLGFLDRMASGAIALSHNVDILAVALFGVGAALLVAFGPVVLAVLSSFGAMILANPIGLIAVAVATLVVGIEVLGTRVPVTTEAVRGLLVVLSAVAAVGVLAFSSIAARAVYAGYTIVASLATRALVAVAFGLLNLSTVAATVFAGLRAAVLSLYATLLTNPFVALATGVAALVSLIAYSTLANTSFAALKDGTVTLADAFNSVLSYVKEGIGAMAAWAQSVIDAGTAGGDGLKAKFGAALIDMSTGAKKFTNDYIGFWVFAVNAVVVVWNQLPSAIKDAFLEAINWCIDKFEGLVNRVREGINSLNVVNAPAFSTPIDFGRVANSSVGAAAKMGSDLAGAAAKAFSTDYIGQAGKGLASGVDAVLTRAHDIAAARLKRHGIAGNIGADGTVPEYEGEPDKKKAKAKREPLSRAELLANVEAVATDELKMYSDVSIDYTNREEAKKVDDFNKMLRGKRMPLLSTEEADHMREVIGSMTEMKAVAMERDKVLKESIGPRETYNDQERAIKQLVDAHRISEEAATRAHRDASMAFFEKQHDEQSGQLLGRLEILKQIDDKTKPIAAAMVSIWNSQIDPIKKYNEGMAAVVALKASDLGTTLDLVRAERDLRIAYLATRSDQASGLELGRLKVGRELDGQRGSGKGLNASGGERLAADYVGEYSAVNKGMQDAEMHMKALKALMVDDPINKGAYALQVKHVAIEIGNLQLALGKGSGWAAMRQGLKNFAADFKGVLPGLTQAWGTFFSGFVDGAANSIGRAIVYGENLGTALKQVAGDAISSLIGALVKLGIQWLVMQVIGTAAQTAQAAVAVTTGAATAAAWAPAAAAVSLATFGANAIPAAAGASTVYALTMGLSKVTAHADGGYISGPGGPRSDSILTRVSNGEFIMNAVSTGMFRPMLEAMNSGHVPHFANGGIVGGMGTPAASLALMATDRRVSTDAAHSGGDHISIAIDARGAEAGVEKKIGAALDAALPVFLDRARKQNVKDLGQVARQRISH